MFDDLPIQYRPDEMDRNAYNAAFYELGFRWHWDQETYQMLLRQSAQPADRIRQYLEIHQSHLLRAYEADFLVEMIQEKKIEYRKRAANAESVPPRHFDWSRMLDAELGA